MRRALAPTLVLAFVPGLLAAQGGPIAVSRAVPVTEVAEPFKLGTFEIDGEDRVGIVLRDAIMVELDGANRLLERELHYPRIPAPAHMLELIERYEYGLRYRIYEIVNESVRNAWLSENQPDFVHDVCEVRTLAPIRNPYPSKILNAAVNYYDHISEALPQEERERLIAERRQDRGHPYLFHKSVRGAVIGNGDRIVIPHGRDHADWEVELAVVMGRTTKYVHADQAHDAVFGYTIEIDVSDRAGRPGGGSDWLVGKGRDTYAPMGPWITPKEFFPYPERDVHQRVVLLSGETGAVMQDSGTEDMIHTVAEVIEYASSVMSLFPGDVIAVGSPSGVGSGTAVRGYQWFMQEGNVLVAEIEGIGRLVHPVVKEQERPDESGQFLPPTPWAPSDAPTTPWESERTIDLSELRANGCFPF
jgi:2-keto-4-pentenoate hydratase/2-oxohepta-3-ene-1,7-dioic acid hydratase in catechol pathway